MQNIKDLYTQSESTDIVIGDVKIGTLVSEFHVRAYNDMRNLKLTRGYMVTARQRIIIPGNYVYNPTSISSFANYPAVIKNSLQPVSAAHGSSLQLLDYFPRTINTTISTSQNGSVGTAQSYMSQSSSGSSTSQTNSFEVSDQLGFFGDLMTGGSSVSAGSATTSTTSDERSRGRTASLDSQTSSSATMSVKDWSVYATIDAANRFPTWLWGQEYPWDILQFHNLVDNNSKVVLPDFVKHRLYDGTQVYPPSQLALYGVNFHASAKWRLLTPEPAAEDETLIFDQDLSYYTATHEITPPGSATLVASIDHEGTFPHTTTALNLPVLGLDPITGEGPGNGALLGFAPQEFLLQPSRGSAFRIFSAANNLYVTGTGFNSPSPARGYMQTTFPTGVPVKMKIQFKIVDLTKELSLFIKHWKTAPQGCRLSIVINGNTASPIIRHVDSLNAGSGSDNVTTVILRNTDYTSDDYYNYLVAGLNTIEIAINPTDEPGQDSGECGYAIRALAIG
jgi:hypothetical protein